MPSAVVGSLRVELAANSGEFSNGMRAASREVQNFGRAANANSAPVNGFRSQIQNASFQVGDFAVQVAGGTSALRAFGQQLPQLLGGFGVFGAVAGAVAAVGLALAGSLLGSKDKADTADDAMKRLSATMADAKSATELLSASQEDLAKSFGSATAGAEVAIAKARDSIGEIVSEFRALGNSAFQPFVDALDRARVIAGTLRQEFVVGRDDVAALGTAFHLPVEQAQALQQGMLAFQNATTAPALSAALLSVYRMLSDWKAEMGELPTYAEALRASLGGVVDQLVAATAQTKELGAQSAAAADEMAKLASARMQAAYAEAEANRTEDSRMRAGRGLAPPAGLGPFEDGRSSADRGTFLTYADRVALGRTDPRSPKYKPAKAKARGTRENGLERSIDSIEKQTAALNAQTAAQAKLNPLVNDYGRAEAQAKAEATLLTVAQQAGLPVTDALKQKIGGLAQAYADAAAAQGQLQAAQAQFVEQADKVNELGRDVTAGFVQGLIEAKDGADLLSDALSRIGDYLVSDALDSIFGKGVGGGPSVFQSALGALGIPGFARGTGFAPGGLALVGERGPELVNLPRGSQVIPNDLLGSGSGVTVNNVFHLDARGADVGAVARIDAAQKRMAAEFDGKVVQAVRTAQAGRSL